MNWDSVGYAIDARRKELGLTATTLAKASSVSITQVKKMIRGIDPPYSEGTMFAVAKGLHWTPDSLYRIAEGQEPIEDVEALVERIRAVDPEERERIRQALDAMES